MWQTLANVGGFMSGASSFLGGLGIGGGQKTPRFSPTIKAWGLDPKQNNLTDLTRHQIMTDIGAKMGASKKYGIHPLSMLGLPSTSQGASAYVDGGSSGVDLNAMGQGIDRMANVGRSQVQRKLDELALEQATLSNDYLRVQIAGAQKAISQSGQTIPLDNSDPSGNNDARLPLKHLPGVNVVADKQTAKNPRDSGSTAGKHAGFMTIDLGDGQYAEVPKTDEGWAEAIGELPMFYKYPKMAEIMIKRWAPAFTKKKYSKKYLAPWDPRRWKNSKEK